MKLTYCIGLFAHQHEGWFGCNVQRFFVGTILVSGKHDVAMNPWKGKVHELHCCEYRKRKKLNKTYDDKKNLDMRVDFLVLIFSYKKYRSI